MTETLAHGYSSESTQEELSNEYQYDKVKMVFKNLCILVLWTKVASELEGLIKGGARLENFHFLSYACTLTVTNEGRVKAALVRTTVLLQQCKGQFPVPNHAENHATSLRF